MASACQKNNVGAVKRGSAVTFGSTNDTESIFPSLAPSALTGPEGVKSFSSVPTLTNYNGKSPLALPTKPKLGKMDLHKLFQNPGSSTSPSAPIPTNTATSPYQHQHSYQYHVHAPLASSLSPPPPGTPGGAQLSMNAAAFVPRPGRKITIRRQDGTEVDLQNLTTPPLTLRKRPVRIETESAKMQRLAREQKKAGWDVHARKEGEGEEERGESVELAKLGQERILNEEEQQIKKESEEKEKRRIRKKEAKKEKQRIRKEEKERLREEEEEGRLRIEEEHVKEDMERIRSEEEESEEQQEKQVELERLPLEEAERVKAAAEAMTVEKTGVTDEVGEDEVAEAASRLSSQTPESRPEVEKKPKAVLRVDTTTTPLPKLGKRRPAPLDISSAQKSNISAGLPSALGTARIIDDLGRVPYPEGIKSPQAELNINAKGGKFRYDREFLLQFMAICKEKPDVYTPLDALGIRADQASYPTNRDDSGRCRQLSQSVAPPALARQNSTGLGISSSGFGKPGPPQFSMGKFTTTTNGRPSAERFGSSLRAARSSPADAIPDVPLQVVHSQITPTSQDGPSGGPASSVSSPASTAAGQIGQAADKAKTRQENEWHQQDIEWYKQEIGWYRQENGWYQQKIEWYQQVVEWYQQEIEWYQQMINVSHRGSHHETEGVDRQNPDGWTSAGGLDLLQPPPKADDLSQFGKNDGTAPVTPLASERNSKVHDSASCTSPSQNIYSLPGDTDTPTDSTPSISSQPPIHKLSFDIRHGGVPELPPHPRKLQLLPRSRPQDKIIVEATTSEADAKKKINEDLKEFFAIRNLDEAEVYFTTLAKEHHFRLVDKLVSSAIESKEADAQLVGNLFTRVASKGLCSAAAFEEGFTPTMESLDDIAIDVPKAFSLMATMMQGAGLEK